MMTLKFLEMHRLSIVLSSIRKLKELLTLRFYSDPVFEDTFFSESVFTSTKFHMAVRLNTYILDTEQLILEK